MEALSCHTFSFLDYPYGYRLFLHFERLESALWHCDINTKELVRDLYPRIRFDTWDYIRDPIAVNRIKNYVREAKLEEYLHFRDSNDLPVDIQMIRKIQTQAVLEFWEQDFDRTSVDEYREVYSDIQYEMRREEHLDGYVSHSDDSGCLIDKYGVINDAYYDFDYDADKENEERDSFFR